MSLYYIFTQDSFNPSSHLISIKTSCSWDFILLHVQYVFLWTGASSYCLKLSFTRPYLIHSSFHVETSRMTTSVYLYYQWWLHAVMTTDGAPCFYVCRHTYSVWTRVTLASLYWFTQFVLYKLNSLSPHPYWPSIPNCHTFPVSLLHYFLLCGLRIGFGHSQSFKHITLG